MIQIINKKVVDFYKANPNISIDHVNLLLVDMMEKMVHDSMNSTMVSQLLERLTAMELDIKQVKQHSEVWNNLSMKLMEFKKEYMDDIRGIVNGNVSEKISPLLKEYNGHLMDKTTLLFQDILPKNQDAFSEKVKESMKEFQRTILEETNKVSSGHSIQEYMKTFDQKFNTLQLVLTATHERMDSSFKEIKTTQEHQFTNVKELTVLNQQSVSDLLKKMDNSSFKGKISENLVFHILQTLYPSGSIEFVGTTKETGDFILERNGKFKILIENKNWESNVPKDEVEKFMRDTASQKCCGVFLSQHTGIANKENYEINVHDGNVLIYVHHVNNDSEKIKLAIDIVDHFKERLDEMDQGNEVDTIQKEILDKINEEYQLHISQKTMIQKTIKDFQVKLCKQIDDIHIPSLEMYLSSRYTSASNSVVCTCGKPCKNQQAYSAHRRTCKK